jgi:hypothetical protein
MDQLRSYKLVYIASPYSVYPGGLERAFITVTQLAADLLRANVRLFCPITMAHPIAMHGRIDPVDHAIWLPAMAPFMDACDAMLIAEMRGWDESYGVREEIKVFRAAGKPLWRIAPITLRITPHIEEIV